MYSLAVKTTFIEFRSMGFTIDDISEKIGVHRTTLLQWNKELYADIKIAEQNQLDRILTEVGADRLRRVEMLGMQLANCYDMLEKGLDAKYDYLKLLSLTERLTKLLHKELADSRPPAGSRGKSTDKEFPLLISNPELYKALNPDFNPADHPILKQDNKKIAETWLAQAEKEKADIEGEEENDSDNGDSDKENLNKSDSEKLRAAPSHKRFNKRSERASHSQKNERSKNENRERNKIKEQSQT